MIDFNKILNETPVEKAARKQRMSDYRAKLAAEQQRQELMVDKLYDQAQRGYINNEWAENFIFSLRARLNSGLPLTDKQAAKLEEIFEQY